MFFSLNIFKKTEMRDAYGIYNLDDDDDDENETSKHRKTFYILVHK